METILYLTHVETDGTLSKTALEALQGAKSLADALGGAPLVVGLVGEKVKPAADGIARCGAKRFLGAEGADLAASRYASDAAAAEAICRASGATIIVAPGTSRWNRVLPGVAQRIGGRTDTHIAAINVADGKPVLTRWYYRQRMEAALERSHRPWMILLDPGSRQPWKGDAGTAQVEMVQVGLTDASRRTKVVGIEAPPADEQTIRPDAALLFVAGAGWTKKQADGKPHLPEAEQLILGFLKVSKASLGGSKSLVDQSVEGAAILPFMTHLNQVGQTGATPRHPKGLATCCHGEEPHVVGWRFITERRAVNLNPSCGWAQGKADVLYVADAFAVMARLNTLLAAKGKG